MQRKQGWKLDGSGNDKMAAPDDILVSELQSDEEVFAAAHASVNIFLQLCQIAQKDDDNPDAHVKDFVEVTVPRYSDGQFRSHFRMFPAVFEVRNAYIFIFFVCPLTSITQKV